MAVTAMMRRFEIELADSDRGVYETLDLRVAQHPSETERYLVARVLARCLEHGEGIDFTRGLSDAEEPAITERDLRGDLKAWIEIGSPTPDRLHKASKTGARIAIYAWQRPEQLARDIVARGVHRMDAIALHGFEASFLDALAGTLDRMNRWSVSVSGGQLYVTVGGTLVEGAVVRVPIGA